MYSLIIAILLSLGLNVNSTEGKIEMDIESISAIKSHSSFADLGGEQALSQIIIIDNVDPQ